MRFDLVIFDCDGVLVDSESIVNRLFVELVAMDGVVLDEEVTLAELTGSALAQRMQIITATHGWVPGPEFTTNFDARLAERVGAGLSENPGVSAVLAGLPIRRCVASNGKRKEMRLRLEAARLLGEFEHIFSVEDVARPKPAPDIFLHAAKTLAVSPARCAVVEDSAPGVAAARAAGMNVFGYTRITPRDRLAALGATTFEDMAALLPLLLS